MDCEHSRALATAGFSSPEMHIAFLSVLLQSVHSTEPVHLLKKEVFELIIH
jgi:hypothetical protein